MIRKLSPLPLFVILVLSAFSQSQAAPPQTASAPSGEKAWVAISNQYANMLIQVAFKFHPEQASQQGLSQFDTKVSQPTLANEDEERKQTAAVLEKLKAAAAEKQQQDVAEDSADHDPQGGPELPA